MHLNDQTIAVIGLGYVGLPLAVEFGKQRTLLFDINPKRVSELKSGEDHTLECSASELRSATHLRYSRDVRDLESLAGAACTPRRKMSDIVDAMDKEA